MNLHEYQAKELLAKYGATNHEDPNSLPSLHSKQPPLPSNYLVKHPFDNTDMNVRDEVAVSGVWKNRDEASIRNEIGRQFACSRESPSSAVSCAQMARSSRAAASSWS